MELRPLMPSSPLVSFLSSPLPTAPPLLLLLLLLALLGEPGAVHASAIASWWVDTDEAYAPQIFTYNATTGKIYASLCNSVSYPVLAQNDSSALDTAIAPAAGTSIASLGYVSGGAIQSNVFYLASLDGVGTTIASASYSCDNTTGHWTPAGSSYNQYVSNGTNCGRTAPSINPNSGLSALYLGDGDDEGMRVFFKTDAFQTHYLQYHGSGDCTGWSYAGIASNLTTGNEVSAAFLSSSPTILTIAQTVFVNQSATADSQGEIEISTSGWGGDGDLWSINRMPTQIIATFKDNGTTEGILTNMSTTSDSEYTFNHTDAWDFSFDDFSGSSARVGTSVNSNGVPSIFYLGTDGYPRRFSSDTQGHWHMSDSQDDSKWPAADAPDDGSPDFGIAYDADNNRIWLFYQCAGTMTQAYMASTDNWRGFTTLSTYSTGDGSSSSGGDSSSSNSSSSSSSSSASSNSGLSTSAKIGLGVGLGVGIPLALAAVAATIWGLRRRRAEREKTKMAIENANGDGKGYPSEGDAAAAAAGGGGPGPDQNQGYWQDGKWIEKTAIEYFAGGPGANDARRRREQLGELPSAGSVFEMSGTGLAAEMPESGTRQTIAHEMPADSARAS